ncbi:MAG: type VI secretion system tube protein TssD [Chloroflexota bacterium]|nr:type VI secretion system tube protein TssD [Chloroflexota bacterium]
MPVQFYVTIDGIKQGRLRGEGKSDATRDKIAGLAFLYEVEVSRVAPSGRSRGSRKHSPVIFVKAWGAASPQLYQALTTNEMLKTVFFEFVKLNADGVEMVYQTVKLFEASLLSIKQEINPSKSDNFPDEPAIERLAMTFQRIEIENLVGKTIAADEWSTGA